MANTAVETTVPTLLSALCSTDMPPRQHLETQQALFKQFAEIIDFTLKFDDLKVALSFIYKLLCFTPELWYVHTLHTSDYVQCSAYDKS